VTSRLDEIDTSVNTVINQFQPVDPVLLLKVGVESSVNVVDNGFPAGSSALGTEGPEREAHLSSLLTKSPKPGVSTTVNFSRTPASSISDCQLIPVERSGPCSLPALMLSMLTVLPLSVPGVGISLG
jgi:hypothetical protein